MNMGQPPSAYLNTKSSVERHDALTDTLLLQSVGLDWKNSPSTTAKPAALTSLNTHTNLGELPLTMTAKTRNKNSSSEKSAVSSQDDAVKKTQKSTNTNGVSGSGPQEPRSGSCLGYFVTTVFYIALIGAAGFAAFHLQQVVEEIRHTSARHEESARQSARQSAELSSKMENVVQQVGGK